MKFILAALATVAAAHNLESGSQFKFMQFIAEHGKSYADAAEYMLRFNLWQKTEDFILANNSGNETHVAGHNYMSDMTKTERSARLGLANMPAAELKNMKTFNTSNAADEVNWVDAGAVTPVKDQGGCGSCWAFSAVAGLEGAYVVDGAGDLTSFSEQQLVECAGYSYGNMACYGGWYYQAWDYLKANKEELESDYPYTSGTTGVWSQCSYDSSLGVVNVASYAAVTPNDPDQLKAAIAERPTSVAIEADTMVFQTYTSGVLTSADCGTTLDHAVTAVGYGTDADSGAEYFLVKNSWASTWGENGYVKIGVASGAGICGINQNAYTVSV
jgi:C1A family cysteine protease